MKAHARLEAAPDGRGGTRLSVMHGESPLLLRRTGANVGPGVTVHLVGGGAGPLRGDLLRLDISVLPGASLTLRSVAAQLALPGRDHLPPSSMQINASVGEGAFLSWLPEPLIAAAGCRHRVLTRVEAAAGSVVLWRDDIVCGRHREPSGAVQTSTLFRYAGQTLYRHDLSVGPGAPGWEGAAVLDTNRAIGTLLVAADDPALLPPATSSDAAGSMAVMPLQGPGMLATAVAPDIRQVRAALDPLSTLTPPGALTTHGALTTIA